MLREDKMKPFCGMCLSKTFYDGWRAVLFVLFKAIWSPLLTSSIGFQSSIIRNTMSRNRHQAAKDIQPGTAAVYPPLPQQGPSGVVPPQLAYMYQRDGQAASNQIASGLDALNLNKKNPELMSAAWNAFFSTLSSGGASPQPHKQW